MVLSTSGIEKYAQEGTNDYQEPLREPRTISGVFHKYRSHIKLESFTSGEARGIPRGCHDLIEQVLHSQGLW